MGDPVAMKEFKDGVELLRTDLARSALPHIRKAAQLDKRNPFYISYLGLALARAEGKWREAETLCYEAVRMKRTQPEFYINLSEVYRLAGKREDAVETLTTGLQLTKQDARLAKALCRLGLRRPPPLSFLDRRNFLNRQLGRLRYRLVKPQAREA